MHISSRVTYKEYHSICFVSIVLFQQNIIYGGFRPCPMLATWRNQEKVGTLPVLVLNLTYSDMLLAEEPVQSR